MNGPHCCQHCDTASEDHDILVRLETNVKAFVSVAADHETRIRRTERLIFLATGFLFALQVVMGVYFTVRFGKP